MSQIKEAHEGLLSLEALLASKDICVYKGLDPIPTNPSSRYRRIENAAMPRVIIQCLTGYSGRYYLTAAGNVNVFSSSARYVDGRERICYLRYDAKRDLLVVREHCGHRGACYSALFPALAHALSEAGIYEVPGSGGQFFVEAGRAADLLAALDLVNVARAQSKLKPVDPPACVTFAAAGRTYFYHKLYWDFERYSAAYPGAVSERISKIDAAIHALTANLMPCSLSRQELTEARRTLLESLMILNATERVCTEKLCILDLLGQPEA